MRRVYTQIVSAGALLALALTVVYWYASKDLVAANASNELALNTLCPADFSGEEASDAAEDSELYFVSCGGFF